MSHATLAALCTFLVRVTVVVLAIVGLNACGGAGRGAAVVRVAGASIDKRLVDHWTTAIARGAAPAGLVSSSQKRAKQQAIAFLISADWLVGEAAEQGLKLSESQIKRRVQEESESTIGGQAEFQETLAAAGKTSLDVGLEIQVQWAASAVHRLLAARAARIARAAVTDSQVGDYYKKHLARYRRKELREFDIAEGFNSVTAARVFARQTGSGARFSKIAFHESYARPIRFDQPAGKGPLLRAIFSAGIGAISRPMWLNHGYAVFVLRHIRPPALRPLAAVRGSIEAHLRNKQNRQAIAELLASYHRKWTAKTDCTPGYVVQKCRQYHGSLVTEDDALLTNESVTP